MPASNNLKKWLTSLNYNNYLKPVASDAGARKYFRLYPSEQESLIVMDASAVIDSCEPFVNIAQTWQLEGINAPKIIASDLEQGFLLLSDMGEQSLLNVLQQTEFEEHMPKNPKPVADLYQKAFNVLFKLQKIRKNRNLPRFNHDLIYAEFDLFEQWFLGKHLNVSLNAEQQKIWLRTKRRLASNLLAQKRIVIHRDFMLRNLLLDGNGNLGVIDFQDAIVGPICYDVISLMRDAFFSLPPLYELWLLIQIYNQAEASHTRLAKNFDFFLLDYFFTGLQRHLKILGVFARLKYRDGKDHYLADAPRFFNYINYACDRYEVLQPFGKMFKDLCKL